VGVKHKNNSAIIPGGFSGGYTVPGTTVSPMAHLGMINPIQTTALTVPFNG